MVAQSSSGTCDDPIQLYPNYVIPNEFKIIKLNLSFVNQGKTGPSCASDKVSDVVYSFAINSTQNNHMSFSVSFTNLDDYLSHTFISISSDCNQTLLCGTSYVTRFLENGDYRLILSIDDLNIVNNTFELYIFFYPVQKQPISTGSCSNPSEIIKINDQGLQNYNNYIKFYQNSLTDSFRPDCSEYDSADFVVSLVVPNDTEIYFELKTFSSDNKFDTIISIADSNCHPIVDMCNDDDPTSVGLGSYLNGSLTTGVYNLIFSAFNKKQNGVFYVNANVSIKNKNDGGSGTCLNPIKLYNGSDIPYYGLKDYIIYGDLNEFKYTKTPSCTDTNLPNVVYSFRLQRSMLYDIQMSKSDGSNKMDTVLELVDSECNSLWTDYASYYYELNERRLSNYCNDDSYPPGGLSSRLSGRLYSREYKLLASVRNEDDLGKFRIKVNFKPYY